MYLDKARSLTKGLRKHLVTVKNYGVSASDLSKLEAAILEGEKLNAEVDRRRAELNEINRIEARGPTSTRGRHGSRPASHPVAAQAA